MSIKDVRSQGVVHCEHSSDKGETEFFRCGAELLLQKIFRKLCCVRMDKGIEAVQREGDQFVRFCADVFYGQFFNINDIINLSMIYQ